VLGEDYIDTFKAIISSGHVDVYPAAAKTTGAFMAPCDVGYPWVLFNYNGYSGDVSTIAHEMGHAMYELLADENQPKQYHFPTLFTHEVASTTNELLYCHYKMSHAANDDERLYYLQNALDLFTETFFTQVMYSEFEDELYRTIEAGGALDGEALSDRYLELLNAYRGDSIVSFPENKYLWAEIPHFYEPYYVYIYATSITYATSIVQGILGGREGAVEDYLSFLKAGRSADPQTLLSIAGVDPLKEETYRAAMDYFKGLVDEYEQLVDARLQK
jgi:oligoendopeptidase F